MNIRKIIKEEIDDFDWVRDSVPDVITYPPKGFFWTVHGIKNVKDDVLDHLREGGFNCHNSYDTNNKIDALQQVFCIDIIRNDINWCTEAINCDGEAMYEIARKEYPDCVNGLSSDEFLFLEWLGDGFSIKERRPLVNETLMESDDDGLEWIRDIEYHPTEITNLDGLRWVMPDSSNEDYHRWRVFQGWTATYPVVGLDTYKGELCYILDLSGGGNPTPYSRTYTPVEDYKKREIEKIKKEG
jgi:hypothetical protein